VQLTTKGVHTSTRFAASARRRLSDEWRCHAARQSMFYTCSGDTNSSGTAGGGAPRNQQQGSRLLSHLVL